MNNTSRILELCAYNIQSCIIAEEAGASRVELCANPADGGVTPGYGTIRYALEHLNIPSYVMIRPRGGNFVYDAAERDIMRMDIMMCKDLGCKGVVLGILTHDNKIDVEVMKSMVELAYPLGVTCHKAFDRTIDASQALEDVISTGCERILTSGLQATAEYGSEMIAGLIAQANGRITIMPGGGVRSNNIAGIALHTGAKEFHSSGLLKGNTDFIADKNKVMEMIARLRS